MKTRSDTTNADVSARPAIEVRRDGQLISRVSDGDAAQLISRGWGEWRGPGSRRHVALTAAAPIASYKSWGGKDGTRPLRGDASCRIYKAGQVMGDPKTVREFRRQK